MLLNYFKTFSIQGLIKLVFGAALILMGWVEREIYIALIGGILMLLTFINKGYCSGGGCSIPSRTNKK